MKTMLSGITATGNLTIGNYLGAIKQFIKYQDKHKMYVFIADLHGITVPIDAQQLSTNIRNIAALYLACGLDPQKSTIFVQSDVSEHANLAHIILCSTTIGELSRMTQYKDKSQKQKQANNTSFIPTGLLTYPALMVADILLYSPNLVPVGQDQKQHVELARNVAQRFNNKYHDLFKIPEFVTPQLGARIMSLKEPSKKMSKSDDNAKNVIFLLDDPKVAATKIKQALTDTDNKVYYNVEDKPGVANLMTIMSGLTNLSFYDIERKYSNLGYREFKTDLAEIVSKFLTKIQTKYHEIINSKDLDDLLDKGAKEAKEIAAKKLAEVKKAIGLSYKL